MLCLENVTKTYTRRGSTVVAFESQHVSIGKGEYVALIGPSGSGKTTLLSMLGGMLSPSTGQVNFQGKSLYDLPVGERARLRRENIGFVFQTFNLIPYLTAIENVEIPLYLGGSTKEFQATQARVLLENVGLADRLHHKPSELSTGQQQRVALARTLANNPPIILADEPTGNLDASSRELVLDFFDELHREGRTIVMVTHDPAAADRASRKLHLRDGQIVSACESRSAAAA